MNSLPQKDWRIPGPINDWPLHNHSYAKRKSLYAYEYDQNDSTSCNTWCFVGRVREPSGKWSEHRDPVDGRPAGVLRPD